MVDNLESLAMIAAKAAVLFAAAGVAHVALRGSAASVRHLVWTAAVCGALALPVLSAALPAWRLAPPVPAAPAIAADLAPETVAFAPPAPASAERPTAWPAWLAALWAAGLLVALARFAAGWLAMWGIVREAEPYAGRPEEVARLAARVGLAREPRVLVSPRIAIPVAWGALRPAVLLPDDARSWSPERREIVLLHELAHVRRRDCATQALAHLACALYWFNPLAWVAASRLRLERERAADDCVLAAGARASEYADHLVEIARSVRGGRAALSRSAAAAIASKSQLEERVRAILDVDRRRRAASRAVGLAVVLVATAAVVPFAAAHPFAAPAAVPSPEAVEAEPLDASAPAPAAAASPARVALTPELPLRSARPDAPRAAAPQEAARTDAEDGDVVAALQAALEDEDEHVRRQAAWALKMIRARNGEEVDFDDGEPTRLRVRPNVRVRPNLRVDPDTNPQNDPSPEADENEGEPR